MKELRVNHVTVGDYCMFIRQYLEDCGYIKYEDRDNIENELVAYSIKMMNTDNEFTQGTKEIPKYNILPLNSIVKRVKLKGNYDKI